MPTATVYSPTRRRSARVAGTAAAPAPAEPLLPPASPSKPKGRVTGGTWKLKLLAAVLFALLLYATLHPPLDDGSELCEPGGGCEPAPVVGLARWLANPWGAGEKEAYGAGEAAGVDAKLVGPLCNAAAKLESASWSELLTEAAQHACETLTRAQKQARSAHVRRGARYLTRRCRRCLNRLSPSCGSGAQRRCPLSCRPACSSRWL